MKFLIVDHYYPEFFKTYYQQFSGNSLSYRQQHQRLMEQLFSTADFYSENLCKLGHPSQTVVVNDDRLQAAWLKEHRPLHLTTWQLLVDNIIRRIPYLSARQATFWQQEVLRQQIKVFLPDIVYIHNLSYLSQSFLSSLKPQVKLIAGQIACPIPPLHRYTAFDLIITSLPHFVRRFKKMGIAAEYLPLCFDPIVLKKITHVKEKYPLTFIGSLMPVHRQGTEILQQISQKIPIEMWGYGKASLDQNSIAYKHHHGEVWGREMYQLFANSQITLNRHSQVSEKYANNLRLFEATGCGALLITDQKNNLEQFFVVGKEIVTYHNSHDLLAKIKYYLTHDQERKLIARAGQMRTLREHTYQKRMTELVSIVKRYL